MKVYRETGDKETRVVALSPCLLSLVSCLLSLVPVYAFVL